MIPLDTLQHATFAALAGTPFRLCAEPPVELVLREAKLLGHARDGAAREPFSLTFTGPRGLRLPQGIRRLECDALGPLEIFLVQSADGRDGSEFEAVFT